MNKNDRFRVGITMLAAGILGAIAWISIVNVLDVSATEVASHMSGYGRRGARPMLLKDVAGYIGAVGGAIMLIGGGWVSFLQLKFNRVESKASGIGKALDDHKKALDSWRDLFAERHRRDREEFERRYAKDREAMIREYATNASVEKVEERMEAIRTELLNGMRAIQNSVDSLRNALKNTGG